jgi:hypothetical protein
MERCAAMYRNRFGADGTDLRLSRVTLALGVVMADECCGSDKSNSVDKDDAEFTAAIEELAKQEKRILAELANPEAAQEFLADPRKVLRRLKIPIPAVVEHRLRLPNANRIEQFAAQPVALPNGQTITPKATVHIVGRER